jgi:hypothetical protein
MNTEQKNSRCPACGGIGSHDLRCPIAGNDPEVPAAVHWAELRRDESGEVRGWLGWNRKDFSGRRQAFDFAQSMRAARHGGVCVLDACGSRLD